MSGLTQLFITPIKIAMTEAPRFEIIDIPFMQDAGAGSQENFAEPSHCGAFHSCRMVANMIHGTVMSWTIKYYSDRVQDEIMSLPAGIQARYIHFTRRMLIHGPYLGMPHSRPMGGGLFELRIQATEGTGRVFYCTAGGQQIIMLHTFIKKTRQTPRDELAIARKRMREVKADAQP